MQYKVVSGDTLFKISQKFYGNGNHYMAIASANGITNPNYIQVGQVIKIPGQEKYGPLAAGEAPMFPPSAPQTTPGVTPSTPAVEAQGGSNTMTTLALIAGAAILGYFVFTQFMGNKEETEEVKEEVNV